MKAGTEGAKALVKMLRISSSSKPLFFLEDVAGLAFARTEGAGMSASTGPADAAADAASGAGAASSIRGACET